MDINSFTGKCKELLSATYTAGESNQLIKILFEHYLGMSPTDLLIYGNRNVTEQEMSEVERAIGKLNLKMPVQYVIGESPFLDLKLKVKPGVLIPRPETEELVLWISEFFGYTQELNVLDACTGSGCVALGIKSRHKNWFVSASDISNEAIETTRENAAFNNLLIKVFHHDILHHPIPDDWQHINVIVSNPPYIPYEERELMDESVLLYEPELALYVENDKPLIFYYKLIEISMTLPACKYCFFEINEYQADNLVKYAQSLQLQWILRKDLNGKNRMIMLKVK